MVDDQAKAIADLKAEFPIGSVHRNGTQYGGNTIHEAIDRAVSISRASQGSEEGTEESFQARVAPWMLACFGAEISGDLVERGDRLLEEVLELLQSGGYDPARVAPLRDYVYSRPVGEPAQEVGGVMVTLAAYCLAADLDMHDAGEAELARVWTKVDKIREKQAAKPKFSPLPVALSPPATPQASEDVRDRARNCLSAFFAVHEGDMLSEAVAELDHAHILATPVTVTMDALERLAEGLRIAMSNDSAQWAQKSLDEAFGKDRIQISGEQS